MDAAEAALADTQREIIEAAELRGYQRAVGELDKRDFSLLSDLADIRRAAGDPLGRLMLTELVAKIAKLNAQAAQVDAMQATCKEVERILRDNAGDFESHGRDLMLSCAEDVRAASTPPVPSPQTEGSQG